MVQMVQMVQMVPSEPFEPFASVTVQVYVPAHKFVIAGVVCPFDQKYIYGDVPPVTVTPIEPSEDPQQETLF